MRRYLLPVVIVLFSSLFTKTNAQVSVQDSLTLVDFYDSTDGPNWGTKWDLTQLVSTWYGVGVTNNKAG